MKKVILVAALIAAPVLAYAEVPEWAAPETSKGIPAEQLKPIADADQAVRNRIFPTVPEFGSGNCPQRQEERPYWPRCLPGLPYHDRNGPAANRASGGTACGLYRP